jgi:hypothetical protein
VKDDFWAFSLLPTTPVPCSQEGLFCLRRSQLERKKRDAAEAASFFCLSAARRVELAGKCRQVKAHFCFEIKKAIRAFA